MDEDKNSVEYEKADNERSFQKVYGWFVVVNKLAGNDYTKHEYIYEKTLVEALNQLSFLINYDEEINRITRQAQGAV
jgi:hypothetical protein